MTVVPAAPDAASTSTLLLPHRWYAVPRISLAEIEWQLARSDAQRRIGDNLPDAAARLGVTPDQAVDYLTRVPQSVLAGRYAMEPEGRDAEPHHGSSPSPAHWSREAATREVPGV